MKKIITLTLLVAICLMSISLVSCNVFNKETPSYDVTTNPDATVTEEENEEVVDKIAAEDTVEYP